MSQPAEGTKASAWKTWASVAAVAVVIGLMLPQLMTAETGAPTEQPKAEAKDGKKSLDYSAPTLPEAPSPAAMLMRLGLGTTIVLGLCVATLVGIRRWMYPTPANGTLPREMRLMETLQLGNRCVLHLVHMGKQPVLVGVDAGGIKTIVPMPTPFEVALQEAEPEPMEGPKLAA